MNNYDNFMGISTLRP